MPQRLAYLLNTQFLGGGCDYLSYSLAVSMQLHGEDIRQGESVRIHLKGLSRFLHQVIPMSGPQSLVFQVHEEGQRISELFHDLIKHASHRHVLDVAWQLPQVLHKGLYSVWQQIDVEVSPERLGPLLSGFLRIITRTRKWSKDFLKQ